MIRGLPGTKSLRVTGGLYVAAFLVFLFAPLVVTGVFAFNDSPFPSPPWRGATLDWFFGAEDRTGVFADPALYAALGVSMKVALGVTFLSVLIGTTNAFLLERAQFPGKAAVGVMLLWPLVIPGVILGISILSFSSWLANLVDDLWGIEVQFLRPGLGLVVLGQFSFIATICTLIIAARLRRFDRSLEEAALNLGANPFQVLTTITLPYLAPALVGAAITAMLMSFENFNTTLMLVGSDQPLTILMYSRMRDGMTPALNALSLLLIIASALLAGVLALTSGRKQVR